MRFPLQSKRFFLQSTSPPRFDGAAVRKLTNEKLRKALAEGEFEGRKAAVAEEILRRRSEERWSKKFGWIGGIAGTAPLGKAAI